MLTFPTPQPRPRRPRASLAEERARWCRLHAVEIEAQTRVAEEAVALARRFSCELQSLRSENDALLREHTMFGYEAE